MTTQLAQDLNRAALLIEQRGWTQHEAEAPDGRLCLTGAIRYATLGSLTAPSTDERVPRYLAAMGAIQEVLLIIVGDRTPTSWNDAPFRRQEEVTRLLRFVAAQAEPEPEPVERHERDHAPVGRVLVTCQ